MREGENLILYHFDSGYLRVKRYLTKPEVKELERLYGKCRGYCISADLITVFAVCEQLERAIERWAGQENKPCPAQTIKGGMQ